MKLPRRWALAIAGLAGLTACSGSPRTGPSTPAPTLAEQRSGTDVLLQAVSAVDAKTVWVSGHGATFVRTTDGGHSWHRGVVPGPDTLQFRDVHAVSADTAYLLSAGPGDMSRIYKTTDAGRTWMLQFTNTDPQAFFDCFDFWDAANGLAFSDAVDGHLVIIRTSDGGQTWTRISNERLPAALPGEGGFAASGTCLKAQGERIAWIATGAGGEARVFLTGDRGDTWSVVVTPIVSGTPTSGIMSLAFRDARTGVALGGELTNLEGHTDNVAVTADGGRTWTLAGRPRFGGAVYGAAYVPGIPGPTIVAVGPKGADYSSDNGHTWVRLDTLDYWSVDFAEAGAGWAVGAQGRIVKVLFE